MNNSHDTPMNLEHLAGDYERDGVIRVRELLGSDLLAEVKAALARYQRDVLPSVPETDRTFEADGTSVRNMWRMDKHDDFFRELAGRPPMRELVGQLVHGEPVLVAVETFNKSAKTGSGVPWHQDNAYFAQKPPDMLTVWIAVDAATVENGAVYYAPGSHRAVLPHVPSGVAGNSMGLAKQPEVPLEQQFCGTLEPGDALIHHCQTMHRSDPNTTNRPRCGLLLVFRGAHTEDDPRLKAAYREALAASPSRKNV